MKLRGKGLIVDAGRGAGFPDYGEVEIDFGPALVTAGAAGGGGVSPYDAPLTGRIFWYELSAELLAAVTGEPLAGGTTARAEAEPHRLPAEPPCVIELAEPAVVPGSETVVGDDNLRLARVAAPPGPDEYAAEGSRLTFSVERAGQYVYVDYFYAEEGAGRTLVLSPGAGAGEFKLLAALELGGAATHLYERELILAAARCRRTGPLAAAEGECDAFGFEFAVENRLAGDVTLYFP
jgi:hypothetical protein